MNNNKTVYDIVTIALLVTVMCVVAPFSLFIGPVPITLTTLVLYVIICIFSPRQCVTAVCVYILIGCIGVPVFSGYTAGVGQLVGPTGGFLLGYIPLCVVSSCIIKSWKSVKAGSVMIRNLCGLFVGMVLLYVVGTWGYMLVTGNGVKESVLVCVVPFVVVDMIKILVAVWCAPILKKRLILAGVILENN